MSASLDTWILTAAALIWLLAAIAFWMRQDTPRRAFVGVSVILFSAAIVYASNVPALFSGGDPVDAVAAAAVVPVSSEGPTMSCSEIRTGMKASHVTSSMGKPDRIVSAEDRRGPTAELWIWQDARCRVYVFEGLVDFVE